MNRNVAATISQDEYEDVLLNKKCFRQSMDRVQSKDYRVWAYEINKNYLSWFDAKMYILNNAYDELTFSHEN